MSRMDPPSYLGSSSIFFSSCEAYSVCVVEKDLFATSVKSCHCCLCRSDRLRTADIINIIKNYNYNTITDTQYRPQLPICSCSLLVAPRLIALPESFPQSTHQSPPVHPQSFTLLSHKPSWDLPLPRSETLRN